MAFYIDRENYFKALAIDHGEVLHLYPASDLDDTPRRSFFRINAEEELLAASQHWIHFPCVVMVALAGGLVNKDGSVRQSNNNTILFLQKVALNEDDPVKADAITAAYENTYDVMQDFMAKILEEYEENEGCGVFQGLDESTFTWNQVGPTGDELFGWSLNFRDETRPKQYEADNWGDASESLLVDDNTLLLIG